jgi:hypothetical protein
MPPNTSCSRTTRAISCSRVTQDADNFYICSVTNGTTLTLDKPYTGQTSANPYRVLQTTDLDGPGTQPYMMAFPELGSAIAERRPRRRQPNYASAGYSSAADQWRQLVFCGTKPTIP